MNYPLHKCNFCQKIGNAAEGMCWYIFKHIHKCYRRSCKHNNDFYLLLAVTAPTFDTAAGKLTQDQCWTLSGGPRCRIEPYKWKWHVWAAADRTECVATEVWWSAPQLMKWELVSPNRLKRDFHARLPRQQCRLTGQTTPHTFQRIHTHDSHRLFSHSFFYFLFKHRAV